MLQKDARALWDGNESKREKLAAVLADPILQEAAGVLAISSIPGATIDQRPDVLLARDLIFLQGYNHFWRDMLDMRRPAAAPAGALPEDFDYIEP